MGKSKSAKPETKKESKFKIPVIFDCPKCREKKCVRVVLKRQLNEGLIYCKGACKPPMRGDGEDRKSSEGKNGCIYSGKLKRLEDPVDIYFQFYEGCRLERQQELRATGAEDGAYDDMGVFGRDAAADQQFNEDMMYGDGGGDLLLEGDDDDDRSAGEYGGAEAYDFDGDE